MKDLTQYKWAVSEALFNLTYGHWELKETIDRLRYIESHALANVKHKKDAGLWFRFSEDDTAATTIRDIERTYTIEPQKNREFMTECIKQAISLNGEIFVYLS
jgi:hypothetical protein